jgi:GntR family transcriptional regulator, arabinose operon transcriptional repressor
VPDQLEGPKYRRIFETLREGILSGAYPTGGRLPSESALVKTFGASRLTVNRALRELQSAGAIERRVGSGSYVRQSTSQGHTFGLLIPDLGETEIFEPICRGMVQAQVNAHHVLLWTKSFAETDTKERQALSICRQLVTKKVSGVFFAPLELTADNEATNKSIANLFDKEGIPLVLLDRDLVPFPRRSSYDIVGIDNRRAGYVVASHLLRLGCQRLAFVGRPKSAPTVDLRIAGFLEALWDAGIEPPEACVARIEPSDQTHVQALLGSIDPDGIVCGNDYTAAQLMRTFQQMGRPTDHIRIAGIDDVKYASLLPVPLTTVHQPCAEIGAAAIDAMTQRIKNPDLPARDIWIGFDLVVRESCGSTATV